MIAAHGSALPSFPQSNVSQCASPHNPTAITAEEYFDPEFELNGRDIGRPIELTSKVQKYDMRQPR